MYQENNTQQENTNVQQAATQAGNLCPKCHSSIGEGEKFCLNCGEATQITCPNCETVFSKNQVSCPVCGHIPQIEVINSVAPTIAPKKSNKKLIAIIASAVLVVVAIVLVIVLVNSCSSNNNQPAMPYVAEDTSFDFAKKFADYKDKEWCTIASDGSYMKIDSNPHNVEEDDFRSDDWDTFLEADEAIEKTNKELGFGEALFEKMSTTTWSQGVQTDENENYKVSWTYHPDKGIEVMYEKK